MCPLILKGVKDTMIVDECNKKKQQIKLLILNWKLLDSHLGLDTAEHINLCLSQDPAVCLSHASTEVKMKRNDIK